MRNRAVGVLTRSEEDPISLLVGPRRVHYACVGRWYYGRNTRQGKQLPDTKSNTQRSL